MATQTNNYAHPEALVDADWLEQHRNDEGIRIVESNEDILLYDTGHIPGAVHIEWREFVDWENGSRFKPAAEIRAMLEGKGVTRDKRVVPY